MIEQEGRGQTTLKDISSHFGQKVGEGIEKEIELAPHIEAFQWKLIAQATRLFHNEISDEEFLNSISIGEPMIVEMHSGAGRDENEDGEGATIFVERTADRKIKLRTPQTGEWPEIRGTLELSEEDERLVIKDALVRYVPPADPTSATESRGNFIDANTLIDLLINLVPYDIRRVIAEDLN